MRLSGQYLFLLMRLVLLLVGTLFFLVLSWRALDNPRSHGFFRFFAFEGCLIMVVLNIPFWFKDPLFLRQIVSWILLGVCILVLLLGYLKLLHDGKPKVRKEKTETYRFEETTVLIKDGIYRYIRHPMYSSLLFFSWGAWLKHISVEATITAMLASMAILITAKIEEAENIGIFGRSYEAYIKETNMFIPFIL